jgi:hypothetical protein
MCSVIQFQEHPYKISGLIKSLYWVKKEAENFIGLWVIYLARNFDLGFILANNEYKHQ